jgi:ribosomal protein L34
MTKNFKKSGTSKKGLRVSGFISRSLINSGKKIIRKRRKKLRKNL